MKPDLGELIGVIHFAEHELASVLVKLRPDFVDDTDSLQRSKDV